VHDDDTCWGSDEEIRCYTCHNEYSAQNEIIRDYHCGPELVFYGKDTPHIGVELEVEVKDNERQEIAEGLHYHNDDLFWTEEDGSINYGFEIVSMPCSLEYHQNSFPWKAMVEYLSEQGCRSHDTTTCGLHVHVSIGNMTREQLSDLVFFVHTQKTMLETLARRGSNGYTKFKDVKKGDTTLSYNRDRYEAVNLQNDNTIEFRLWRGTLKYDTLIATIELSHAIVEFIKVYAKDLESTTATYHDFIRYINDNECYTNARAYMRLRGISLPTKERVK
jgi:hypothetical protein